MRLTQHEDEEGVVWMKADEVRAVLVSLHRAAEQAGDLRTVCALEGLLQEIAP